MSSLNTSNKGAENPQVPQSSKKNSRWAPWVTGAVIIVAVLIIIIIVLSRGSSEESTQTVIYHPQSEEVHSVGSENSLASSSYRKEVLRMKLPPNLGTITMLNLLLRAKSDPDGTRSEHPHAHGLLFDILDTTQKSVLNNVGDIITPDGTNVLRLFNLSSSREFTTLTANVARILQEDRQIGHLLQPGYTVVIYIAAKERGTFSATRVTGHLEYRPLQIPSP